MMSFTSQSIRIKPITLPEFSDLRVMMLPVVIGEESSYPDLLGPWRSTLAQLADLVPEHTGRVGYITVDEKVLQAGETMRRPGKHVDGVYRGADGGWGGGGGSWGSKGLLTVSSAPGCRVWNQEFQGQPGSEGECDHLADQCGEGELLEADEVYWMHGLCVHESLPMDEAMPRQFARLSLPSDSPWFEGYTANPLGVSPTGPVLPRRDFLGA